MSFSSSVNRSLAWTLGNGGAGRVFIKSSSDLDTWLREQSCTEFQFLQHRKERKGLQHEFIVLELLDGSLCRFERMADPNARLNALSSQGSVAYDLAQCFKPDKLSDAKLDTSDVVARIGFPRSLGILDVLRVCRAMHEGEKTCNYTLQVFNCYFFAIAIQAALTRMVADWRAPFSDERWTTIMGQVIDGLSRFYQTSDFTQDHRPLLPRIYSLLRPHAEWPTQLLVEEIQKRLREPLVLRQINIALNSVLWHSTLGSAVDDMLETEVQQAMVNTLKKDAMNTFKPLGSPHCIYTTDPIASRRCHFDAEVTASIGRLKLILADLVACAVLSREALKSKQRKQYILRSQPLFFWLLPNIQRFNAQDFWKNSPSYPSLPHSAKVRASVPPERPYPSIWWAIVRTTMLWAFWMILDFFWVTPLCYIEPRDCFDIDLELSLMLASLSASGHICLKGLLPSLQKIYDLCKSEETPVSWDDWPWTHTHELIKQHILDFIADQETTSLNVSLQSGTLSKPMFVSSFQLHLLCRLQAHCKLVESLGLGTATHICNELEDRLSQVWAVMRNDDWQSIDLTTPPISFPKRDYAPPDGIYLHKAPALLSSLHGISFIPDPEPAVLDQLDGRAGRGWFAAWLPRWIAAGIE